ncbi:accessory gene regulator ArgB-like protein [Clostridium sp.]|uniref:accessory gene regulator ArgB-like protein n=1 Tax=Clostridium sp. TaxID=1506 RepID=UPI0026054778|nr:accessory gene regulator B family protein [Clostridium sp.]
MFLTEKIAMKIGKNAKVLLNVDEDNEQIIIYGAINLLQIISAILWVIIAGFLLGVVYEALIFSITVSVFRKYSGGVHASSPSRCIIIGTVVASAAGIVTDKILCKLNIATIISISVAVIILALIIVIKKAPVDSVKKPITNIEMKKQFKKKSIITIIIYSVIILTLFILNQKNSEIYYINAIECISLGILWQTITLTKGGISLLNKVDLGIKYIIERGEKSN